MKLRADQVFIGNIKKCIKYDTYNTFNSDIYVGNQCIGGDTFGYVDIDCDNYKDNAILIQIDDGPGYVDLDTLNSILDYIKVCKDITEVGYYLGGLIMSTAPHCLGSLFVVEESLKPYYKNMHQKNNISIHKLKKQLKSSGH